jgi:nitrite reductase (NADH) large subunit
MFGESNLAIPATRAERGDAHGRRREDLRLQRRLQGHDRRGDQGAGLFTLEDVRRHTKASSSCGRAPARRADPDGDAGGDYSATPKQKRSAAAPTHAPGGARRDPRARLLSIPDAMASSMADAERLRHVPAALNYYLLSTWPQEAKDDPQSRFINERAHANIQKDGTFSVVPRMWGGETTPRAAPASPTSSTSMRSRR